MIRIDRKWTLDPYPVEFRLVVADSLNEGIARVARWVGGKPDKEDPLTGAITIANDGGRISTIYETGSLSVGFICHECFHAYLYTAQHIGMDVEHESGAYLIGKMAEGITSHIIKAKLELEA